MSEAPAPDSLDGLLAAAREASPSDRIELRDSIAAHGEDAIEAMTDWLGEPRLAAFAIRVLERIGRQPTTKRAVLEVLAAVDREELPAPLARDVDQALAGLGGSRTSAKDRRSGSGSQPTTWHPRRPGSRLLGDADEPVGAAVHLGRSAARAAPPGLGLERGDEPRNDRRGRPPSAAS